MATAKTVKERKEEKLLVEQLLRIEGIDYDEWLDGLHQEILGRSSTKDIMMKALQSYLKDSEENIKVSTDSNEKTY